MEVLEKKREVHNIELCFMWTRGGEKIVIRRHENVSEVPEIFPVLVRDLTRRELIEGRWRYPRTAELIFKKGPYWPRREEKEDVVNLTYTYEFAGVRVKK